MTYVYKPLMFFKSMKVRLSCIMFLMVSIFTVSNISAQGVFFSQYVEGSSNNKAIEIFNGTDAILDLSTVTIKQGNNGSGFDGHATDPTAYTTSLVGMLAPGEVFVIANGSASDAIKAVADTLFSFGSNPGDRIVSFNGDDAMGLFVNDVLVDLMGDPAVDPGSDWAVAGTGATKEFTLTRKYSVTTGNTIALGSFGTDADDSEWIVSPQDDITGLGEATPAFTQPEPPYEVGDNIVGNGSFDAFVLGAITEGSLNWSFNMTANGAAAAFEIVDGSQDDDSRALKIVNGAFNNGDDWNVEAVNEPINVVEGETYRATIWLKADTDTRVARFYYGLPASGNWARYEETDVTLSTEWTKYSLVYTATSTDVENTMRFATSLNFAENADGTIWMDNLTVTKLPEPVKVTFNVNTATMPDTLQPWHVLQVRGGTVGPDGSGTGLGSIVTWDSGSMVTENVGGDYWTITFDMSAGDTLNYKFWAGVDTETPLVNGGEQGWESGNNNQFILASDAVADTTVPLQWFETRAAPFTTESDSVTVFFRVNVGAQLQVGDFDPETDKVGVRGNGAFFAADWGTGNFLSEGATNGKNLFYEGIVRAQKDSVAAIDGSINYKFVIESGGDVTWESTPDRPITIPASDTTAHWVYFNDTRPSDQDILETNLNFEVNVGILEGLGFFNSSIDTVFVTGTFNAWNNSENQMAFNSFSGNYEASNLPFTTVAETQVLYKYFVKWDASRDDEESENFLSGITHDGSGWEEPGVTGGADRTFTIEDVADQPVRSEFYNGVSPSALLTSNNVDGGAITVTFSIDMSAAEENEAQPFLPASDSVYLFVDTPFFALTNGITVPGDNGENFVNTSADEKERLRFTDEDADGVYELDLELTLPTLNHIGFRIAYGEPTSEDGSLFANGGGFAAGRRHYQYVQPMIDANLDVTWPASFTMETLDWQATNLDWETPPDYTQMTTSSEEESGVAEVFSLDQNYPNPFNPTTNISFNLPNASNVTLAVYNLLGQRVATLINGKTMTNGVHSVAFDARALSSGVYIYRLEAGSFVSNKRMTLIK